MSKKWLIYIFSVLSNITLIVLVLASLDPAGLDVYFNSDTLYLPSIYKDLFIDKVGISGWHLNPAPNFFPDMILYFLIRSLSGDFLVASFIFSIVQFLGFTCLIYFLNTNVYGKPNLVSLFFVHMFLNLVLLVSLLDNDVPYTAYILLNSYHMGAFIMALLGYVLVFRYLRASKSRTLIWIAVIVFLGVLSDKLFVVLYVMPVLMWTLLFWKSTFIKKHVFKVLVVSTIPVVFSLVILNLLSQFSCFKIGTPHRMLDFANIPEAMKIFYRQTSTYITDLNFKTLVLIITIMAFLVSFIRVIKWMREKKWSPEKDGRNEQILIFSFLTVFFIPFVLLAPVINGNYTGWDSLRYNIYAYLWGLIALGFFIGNVPSRFIHTGQIGLFLIMGLLPALVSIRALRTGSSGLSKFFSYYPERVEVIDSLARKKGLAYGLANYWDAKLVTMLSRENVRVYAVFDDLTPYFHVANENWYYGGKGGSRNLNFTFILTGKFRGVNQIPDEILEKSEHSNIRGYEIFFIPAIGYRKGSNEPFLVNLTDKN
jgi:hypothetical protein